MRLNFALCLAALAFVLAGCAAPGGKGGAGGAGGAGGTAPVPPTPAPVAGSALKRVQEKKELRIGIKADSPPFCFQDKDGNPLGFDVDLGARIARALGAQPVFVTITNAERLPKLKNGELDVVIATLTATRRRAQEVDFSIPYFQDHQSLLVKAASPLKSYRDLAGKKVAAAAGSTSIDNLKVVAPDAQIVEVKSVAEGFEKLKAGEVDGLTSDGIQLMALRLKESTPTDYRIAGEGFSVEPYVVGVPQNDSAFRGKVDEALSDIWNSGVWTRLYNKWLGEESQFNLEAKFQMPVLPP